MKHWISLGASVGLGVLALGSLPAGRLDEAEPGAVTPVNVEPEAPQEGGGEDTAVEVQVPDSPGDPSVATELDRDAAACLPGHFRVGAAAGGAGVPWVRLPELEPPPGLHINGTDDVATQARILSSPPGDADQVRWCIDAQGTAEGPFVIARLEGRLRLYGALSDGVPVGVIRGFSYTDDPQPERNVEELEVSTSEGVLSGPVHVKCPLQDMAAVCPVGANVDGAFADGQRTGEWSWHMSDGVSTVTVTVRYREGQPVGEASHLRAGGGVPRCESRGKVDDKGRQGVWRERCDNADQAVVTTWVDGEPQ